MYKSNQANTYIPVAKTFRIKYIITKNTTIMAGYTSLESAIRGCQVNTGYADKLYSDRFLNPGNMVCPIWNGYDSTGRPVCADSFATKTQGCNSASDRVEVENYQRPQYVEYVNLTSAGIAGEFYNPLPEQKQAQRDMHDLNSITGNFGIQWRSAVKPNSSCGLYSYEQNMQNQALQNRYKQMEIIGYDTSYYKNLAGCGV
jgi:hypothetical protein